MFSKQERKFLQGEIKVNKRYENKIRFSILNKITKCSEDLKILLENKDFCNSSRHTVDFNIPFHLLDIKKSLESIEINLVLKEVKYYGTYGHKMVWEIENTKLSNSKE